MTTDERQDKTKLFVEFICNAGYGIVTVQLSQFPSTLNSDLQWWWGEYNSAVDTNIYILSFVLGTNSDSLETSRQIPDTTDLLFKQDGQKQGKVFRQLFK